MSRRWPQNRMGQGVTESGLGLGAGMRGWAWGWDAGFLPGEAGLGGRGSWQREEQGTAAP